MTNEADRVIDNDDIKQLQSIFDDRYVKDTECNERQAEVNKKFANDDKRIERQESFNESIKKCLWIGAAAVIGDVLLKLFEIIKG